jgi:hypothetical protein
MSAERKPSEASTQAHGAAEREHSTATSVTAGDAAHGGIEKNKDDSSGGEGDSKPAEPPPASAAAPEKKEPESHEIPLEEKPKSKIAIIVGALCVCRAFLVIAPS